MNYLLDTCVVSELLKKDPDKNVLNWISELDETSLYLSVLTFGEIHKGIEKLPEGRKKDQLHKWVNSDLRERFENRILNLNLSTATTWGELEGRAELAGKPMSIIDGLIAATGIVNDLVVVTRNTKDMEQSGVSLFNPWL
jgi:predicted nucleic acid-binding protein